MRLGNAKWKKKMGFMSRTCGNIWLMPKDKSQLQVIYQRGRTGPLASWRKKKTKAKKKHFQLQTNGSAWIRVRHLPFPQPVFDALRILRIFHFQMTVWFFVFFCSECFTIELQSFDIVSYAVFCFKKSFTAWIFYDWKCNLSDMA